MLTEELKGLSVSEANLKIKDFLNMIMGNEFNEDNLEIKYEVVGQKKDEENNNSEFFKKIENYFKGEN